ncbi:MAG: hypothetical protein EBQ80_06060, partial [Proteobacteria bacterium]|nr:hypothetical protein [Pseudomonadota bacterium]
MVWMGVGWGVVGIGLGCFGGKVKRDKRIQYKMMIKDLRVGGVAHGKWWEVEKRGRLRCAGGYVGLCGGDWGRC